MRAACVAVGTYPTVSVHSSLEARTVSHHTTPSPPWSQWRHHGDSLQLLKVHASEQADGWQLGTCSFSDNFPGATSTHVAAIKTIMTSILNNHRHFPSRDTYDAVSPIRPRPLLNQATPHPEPRRRDFRNTPAHTPGQWASGNPSPQNWGAAPPFKSIGVSKSLRDGVGQAQTDRLLFVILKKNAPLSQRSQSIAQRLYFGPLPKQRNWLQLQARLFSYSQRYKTISCTRVIPARLPENQETNETSVSEPKLPL